MSHHARAQIYQGMIQYILDSTHYTLKNIAQLSDSSIDSLRVIYRHRSVPQTFTSDIELMRLYQIILEIRREDAHYRLAG